MWVIAYVAILTGVVFISSHVLEVKWVMIFLLLWARYNSLIHNHMKLSSDYSRYFPAIVWCSSCVLCSVQCELYIIYAKIIIFWYLLCIMDCLYSIILVIFFFVGVCCFPNVQLQRASCTMKAESVNKVSIFYILVQVYSCWFPTGEFWRVCFTMKAESVTKVSIFYILVRVYCCRFPSVEFWRVSFTMKAESVTKVSIFLHIGTSVLLLFSNCRVLTSLFHQKAESVRIHCSQNGEILKFPGNEHEWYGWQLVQSRWCLSSSNHTGKVAGWSP